MNYPLIALVLAVLGVVGLITVAVILRSVHGEGDDMARWRHASARWARPAQVKKLMVSGPTVGRVRLGWLQRQLLAAPLNRSVGVMAPSGSGKTPRILVPIVNEHRGPAVVGSVKADAYWLTHSARQEQGNVFVFDPTGVSGLPSSRWSPLLGVWTWASAWKAASDLCDSSKAQDGRGLEGQAFWDSMGRQMIAPMLFVAARLGKSIGDVSEWMQAPATESLITEALEAIGEPKAISQWELYTSMEARTKSNVKSTASTIMEVWGRPEIAGTVDITGESERPVLDIEALFTSDATVYLIAPASEQAAFTPVFETLVNAIIRRVEMAAQRNQGRPLSPPLLLALDEAANIAPLRNLDQVLSKSAGEGMIVLTVWQDYGQMEKQYGPAKARTIWANHWAKMYLPGINDQGTLRQLTEAVGQDVYQQRTISRGGGHTNVSVSPHTMDVATPDFIRSLPADQCIVISGSYPAMLLRVPAWFEDHVLRAAVDPHVAAHYDHLYGGQG